MLPKNLVTFKRYDGIKDKNFNILGVHWKNRLLEGGLPKKGAWTVCWLNGEGWQEKGVVFLRRGWYLMHTM